MNIRVENLKKNFNGRNVLDGLSFEVEKGEHAAIVGPNGAGKTTLVRIINLLDAPTSGDVYFDDISFKELEEKWPLRRRMAVVFQRPAVFNTSVYTNVAMGLKIREEEKSKIDAKVLGILETVGLAKHKEKNARTLSGGEKQLLALARSVVLEPELLLLDEPMSNLDTANTKIAEEIIKNVDATVIMTSPREDNAEIADRIITLSTRRPI
jgi:tungstate transport system ATP-binding protein